jgi:hypothetical protein
MTNPALKRKSWDTDLVDCDVLADLIKNYLRFFNDNEPGGIPYALV